MSDELQAIKQAIPAFKQLKSYYLNRALNCDGTESEVLLAKAEAWGRLELDSQLALVREMKS